MCIIVYKPKTKLVSEEILRACFEYNSHGAGYMYPDKGAVKIRKGFFTFEEFLDDWNKKALGADVPAVIHFRIATAGKVDNKNCHPHRISHDLAFAHNGILHCVDAPIDSKVSDTIIYRNVFLRKYTGSDLNKSRLFRTISHQIGSGNKFVFMNGDGKVVICNEKSGMWDGGVWYSNGSYKAGSTLWKELDKWGGYYEDDFCMLCGSYLDSVRALDRGVCDKCFRTLEPDSYTECTGCGRLLFDDAHRETGWCDICGEDVYSDKWDEMVHMNDTNGYSHTSNALYEQDELYPQYMAAF